MKLILLPLLLMITGQLAEDRDTLDRYIEHRMDVDKIPGMSMAIIEPGGEVIYKNFGYTDTEQSLQVDEHTIFEIGSITKTFTAGLIHILLDEREKEPETTYYRDTEISLHHLLTHHSGLPRLPDNLHPDNPADPYRDYTDALMHDFINNHQSEYEPGSQFIYSNLGYMLLGNFIEDISGKSYDEAIYHYVTNELDMNSTSRQITDSTRFATPSMGGTEVHEWNFDGVKGVGGIRSTASDMVSYLKMMMGYTDHRFSDSFRETVHQRIAINGETDIAHSWFISTSFDDEIIHHDGHTGGSSAFVGYSTVSGKGVVLLTNSNQSIVDIGLHILNNAYSLEEIPEYTHLDIAELEKLVGSYESEILPDFTIFKDDRQLYGQMEDQQALPLNAISDTEFENRSVQARIVFKIDDYRANSLTLHQGGQSYLFERKGKAESEQNLNALELSSETLEEFTGIYSNPEGIEMTIRLDNGNLTTRLTGQNAFNIFPKGDDIFFLRVVDAELHFSRDGSHNVSGVTLHQAGNEVYFGRN